MKKAFLLCFVLMNAAAMASSLPSGMSANDVGTVVNLIGPASALRLLRSAEPYLPWPGIKVGIETMLIPGGNINNLGNGDGSLPGISPVPRLYFSKGLFFNTEITFVWLPSSLINTVSTLGVAGRITFLDEKEDWLSSAAYVSYTSINAFNSTYLGDDWEIGLIASKDYVRAKPYVGGGVLMASGSVVGGQNIYINSRQFCLHTFFGIEFELPITLTVQFDVMNLNPSGSLFFGKHF
jgi:hypothetical protein